MKTTNLLIVTCSLFVVCSARAEQTAPTLQCTECNCVANDEEVGEPSFEYAQPNYGELEWWRVQNCQDSEGRHGRQVVYKIPYSREFESSQAMTRTCVTAPDAPGACNQSGTDSWVEKTTGVETGAVPAYGACEPVFA